MNRNPYRKPQHQIFICEYLNHGDKTKAYFAAYPKSSAEAARTGAIRLLKYENIRQQVEPILQERLEADMDVAASEATARIAKELQETAEKRAFLARVILSEVGNPSAQAVISAIELDCKLEAGYSRKDVIERQFNKLASSFKETSEAPGSGNQL